MRDPKRISVIAILLLLVLRISIGWQFLYEGLWKLNSMSTPNPWSAAGYLGNAQGPYRDEFRSMLGDPDELNWLDYDYMSKRWDDWAERFKAHYQLSEDQSKELTKLLIGPEKKFSRPFELPEGISFARTTFEYDEKSKLLSFPAWQPPTPTDFARIQAQLPSDPQNWSEAQQKFSAELKRLRDLSIRLSYQQQLAGQLKGDPGVTGVVFYMDQNGKSGFKNVLSETEKEAGEEEDEIVIVGDKQVYLNMLADYNEKLKTADQDFEFDHLSTLWKKIQEKKSSLVGPVKSLDADLKESARKLLTYQQIALGPVPTERTEIADINRLTIWALLILGGCLIAGLMTRLAAVAGAGMLMSFYLVWPPWPGVPEAPGPEHALFINKNSIEAVALLAIAFLPTGRWFGVDAFLGALLFRKK